MEKEFFIEQKIAHLTFIQGIINRMGQNSFLLKGWSTTIITAIFALATQSTNTKLIFVAYFPAIVFWILDAFFLDQERLFIKLYNNVADNTIASDIYTLNINTDKKNIKGYCSSFNSRTLILFHGCILIVLFLSTLLI